MEGLSAEQQRYLWDRQAIWDCLHRYTRGVDRLDRELVLSAYHPDAIDDHGIFVGSPEGFVEWVFPIHSANQSLTNHMILNHVCEIDGDTAHAETYCVHIGVNRNGTIDVVGNRYIDRLERRQGEWRIFRRVCKVDWTGNLNTGELDPYAAAAMGELMTNAITARDRTDISYMRPLEITRPPRFPGR